MRRRAGDRGGGVALWGGLVTDGWSGQAQAADGRAGASGMGAVVREMAVRLWGGAAIPGVAAAG